MAKQTINIGAAPNDGTGTPLRTSFDYCNQNFTELYTATGPSGNNIVVPGSATITGDLTVDTSTLKVDSTNNRVGILTATPALTLDVAGPIRSIVSGGTPYLYLNNGTSQHYLSNDSNALSISVFSAEQMRIAASGVFTWYDGAGGTRMTLNATGLGVGRSPSYKLDVAGVGNFDQLRISASAATQVALVNATNGLTYTLYNANTASNGFNGFGIFDGSAYVLRIDSTGNVGIGVTPSYRIHTAVASGSNQNIARFQVTGASNGLTITWNNTTSKMIVNFSNLPTSSAGLASGDLWIDTAAGNTLKVA